MKTIPNKSFNITAGVDSLPNFKPAILDSNVGEWYEAVKGA